MVDSLKRRQLLKLAGAGVVGSTLVSGNVGANPSDTEYIVGMQPGFGSQAMAAAESVSNTLDFGSIGQAVVGHFSEDALIGLANNPQVRYIEANGKLYAHDHGVGEDDGDPTEEQVIPWGIDRVGADTAHHEDETGSGGSVAVVDTGVDPNHETLHVVDGEAFTICEGDCAEDWDDDHGHGTHVAGTAAALDNEIGVVGVAPDADLYAVKVLDGGGGGTFDDVAAGIEWAADQGIDVINLSLGGGETEVVHDAVKFAVGEGSLVVASAGNDGPRPNSVGYPAAHEEVMAVSATDDDDDIARFSSRGDEVEIAAPGVSVLSSVPDDEYDEFSGTSMSAPHVAGAGAMLMGHGDSNTEARQQLNDTAEDIGLSDDRQGNGLLDVPAALELEDDDDDDDDEEVTVAVGTDAATDVTSDSARLNGELTELEGADSADVGFEYGLDENDLNESVSAGSLSSPGSFDAAVTDLEEDTTYYFKAVADAEDESDSGAVLNFTTEEEDNGDDPVDDPVIDEFDVSTRTTGPWQRADVEWTVSDPDGDLASVTSELLDGGEVLDSETTSLSGSSASGEHELRDRNDDPDTVRLTVTDGAGNEATDEQSVSF